MIWVQHPEQWQRLVCQIASSVLKTSLQQTFFSLHRHQHDDKGGSDGALCWDKNNKALKHVAKRQQQNQT